jgi:UDP-N-acetylglucosamine--N-acetylmuramyl-(pentapeptide) pyrophosphoryl-undecaprenol N-acetylglucosamine transferase
MRALFVANGGGHLKELIHLSQRLPFPIDESLWVTFDSPQSRSLLRGQEVRYVRYSSPRDGWATLVNFMAAIRILRRDRFDVAVSTGATVAVSFLPLARLLGTPSHYVESATRSDGPSLTGRLLRWAPGVQLYTQHASWAGGRWRFAGSVFDQFESTTEPDRAAIERVVVTVGASETYSFERLIRALLPLVPPGADILWQTGCADVEGLGIDARRQVPALELEAAMRDADLVISHAGVGSALSALESGRRPVLVPRERSFGEHVDDHQFQIAEDLGVRNLAVARRVDELRVEDLEEAAASRVRGVGRAAPIAIDPPSWRRRSRRVQRSVASARRSRSVFVAWGAIAGRSHELAEALDADVLSCFPPGTTRRPSAPVRYLLSTVRTVGYLVSRRPRAVIVTNPPIIPALLAVAYARITGRVVVIDDHPGAFGAQGYRIGSMVEPLHRRLVARARFCLVTDASWVEQVERWGGRGHVLHEAPGDWVPAPTTAPGVRPNVLFVCTFAPDEPISEVIAAAAQLPSVEFTITGDSRRRPDHPVGSNVHYVGFLSRSSYRLAVERSDVVLALTTEPTSAMRAAFEAVWAEKVLVVNDWPLLNELFPHAIHVENTADSIALGVRKALKHHDQLVSAASTARQEQLERWQVQISVLRDALADGVPGDRL